MKLIKSISTLFIAVLFLALIHSCKKDDGGVAPPEQPVGKLEKIATFDLEVTEPSGLSFGPGGNTLLMVSDNTNKVYETDLEGNIIRELAYTGGDLEGVTFNADKQIVVVTEERKRQLVFLDYPEGKELERFDIATGGTTDNKGLEGISYSKNNSAYYIVNEDVPGEMIVWNQTYGNISKTELHFASDYSALFVDTKNGLLWMVSDESKALYKCDYNANVLMEYALPETKFEGIVIDAAQQLVYLVNDKTFELVIFKIKNEW
jgi:uncharacterized protein YjiK